MLFALLLVVVLIAACVFAAWSNISWAAREAGRERTGAGAAPVPDRSPQSLEGILVGQLVAGEITGTQYRHAMATLAARDAERHPVEVPPDVAPPEAA